MSGIDLSPLGDGGICIRFLEKVTPELNKRIRGFCRKLEKEKIEGVTEWVPAYETVTVYYLPGRISYREIAGKLTELVERVSEIPDQYKSELIYIPTLYGRNVGEDLRKVAQINDLSEDEVIHLHSGTDYLVYMMGFLPGFPYLGGMSEKIAAPRLESPRGRVPSGSVGIAGEQTGIYPLESPGGWNLIGRTPVKLFDPGRERPFLLRAGDHVRFFSITEADYAEIREDVENNRYEVKKEAVSQ